MRKFRILIVAILSVALVGFVGVSTASASATNCTEDSGVRVEVCIIQDTSSDYISGGHEYVAVTDYRFTIKRIDTSQTTMDSGKLLMRATVYGTCVSACGSYQNGAKVTSTVTLPTNADAGKTYTLSIPWRGAVVKIDDTGATNAVQAANAALTFHFRGKSTTYQTPNLCTGATAAGIC